MAAQLLDPNGQVWLAGADTLGRLTLTAVSGGYEAVVLVDYFGNSPNKCWLLTVDANGFIVPVPTPFVQNAARRVQIIAPDGGVFFIGVIADGRLITDLNTPARQPWIIGQLAPSNGTHPTPQQPGGPGTPVTMPAMQPEEISGKWTAPCGHGFNNWEIIKDYVQGQSVALMCCPVCRYINALLTPYEAIHDEANMAALT